MLFLLQSVNLLQHELTPLQGERLCKYPPAKPEALRLLAPQRGLIATGESKSKNKSKGLTVQTLLAQSRQNEGNILPELSNFYCHPGKAGGSPRAFRSMSFICLKIALETPS